MDSSLFRWVNRLANRTGWAHWLFKANAGFGIALFGLLLLVVYLEGRQHADLDVVAGSVWAGGSALIALGLGQVIGGAVDRARPYEAMANVHLLVDKTTDFSFPSDHATVAGAVAVGLALTSRRWGSAALVLAFMMAFTRVYVGAHYPGDVLGGLVLGGAVAAAGHVLLVPPLIKLAQWLVGTPLRPLLTRAPLPQATSD